MKLAPDRVEFPQCLINLYLAGHPGQGPGRGSLNWRKDIRRESPGRVLTADEDLMRSC